MQISDLSLRNFKQHQDTYIEFSEGLTGFIGKNGSGKSTIFDAIYLALFGKFSAGTNKDGIRNDNAGKSEPVVIELNFRKEGQNYLVRREFRGKNLKAEAQLYNGSAEVAAGASQVTKEIIKLLQMDHNNFRQSFYSEQKEVDVLINSSTKERETHLRKMLGLSKMDVLEKKLKENSKQITERISAKKEDLLSEDETKLLNQEINQYKEEQEEKTKEKSEAEEFFNEIDQKYKKLKSELYEQEKLQKKYNKLQNDLGVKREGLKNSEKRIEELEAELSKIGKNELRVNELEPSIKEFEEIQQKIEELNDLKNKKLKLDYNRKNLENNKGKIDELSRKIEENKSALSEYSNLEQLIKEKEQLIHDYQEFNEKNQNQYNGLYSLRGEHNSKIKQAENRLSKIRKLGKESPCPECERPLGEHYDKLVENYNNDISIAEKKISEIDQKLSEINKKINDSNDKINEFNGELTKLNGDLRDKQNIQNKIKELNEKVEELKKENDSLEKEIESIGEVKFEGKELDDASKRRAELKPLYDEYTGLKTDIERKPQLQEDLTGQKNNREEFTKVVEQTKKDITELKFDEEEFQKLKKKREEVENEREQAKERLDKIIKRIEQIEYNIKDKEKSLANNESLKEKIKEIEREKELYEKLTSVVSSFKTKITSEKLPAISNYASQLFTEITNGRYTNLQIDEYYELVINRDGNDVSLRSLSGGEKDLAGLCLRIAISKVLSGRKTGFLALDEVFGSQDESRREYLLKTLNSITKEFKQIFVISHNQDVHEELPNQFIFEKKGRFTKVT